MTIELGVVVKADGTVELSNGMALGAASTNKLAGALDGLDASLLQTTKNTQTARQAARELADANTAQHKAANVARIQNLQLGAQLQDFFVQVQAGQSPLTAFIQQGSQLSFVYGGFGNAFRAVTALITPARVAFGGLAGVLGAVGVAAYQGAAEQNALARSLVLTGNIAGQTLGSIDALAERLSSSVGTSIGGARETLSALVATGKVGAGALESMATVIEKVSAFSGKAREDVIKDFTQMANEGPVKYAERSNAAYNFLDLAQYRHIKALQEAGRETEAMAFVNDKLSQRLGGLHDNLGILEGGWQGIKNMASGAWDAMLGIGRTITPEERVKQAMLAARGAANPFVKDEKEEEVKNASKALLRNMENASAQAERAVDNKKKIDAEQQYGKILEQNRTKAQQLAAELKNFDRVAATLGLDAKAIAAAKSGIQERFKDKGPDQAGARRQLAEAEYANARAALEGVAGIERRAADERIKTNEQLYRLGLIDVRRYYEEKTTLELASLAVQEKLIAGEIAQAKITQAKATKEADKLAAGTRVIQLENQLAELQGRKDETRINNSNARALTLKGELDELEKRLDAADAASKKAVIDQQLAGRERIEGLKIDQIKDPEERDRAILARRKKKNEELVRSSAFSEEQRLEYFKTINEEMALENELLVEKFKPGWQKMLEEWGNTSRLMKDTYNTAMNSALRSGESEFVRSNGNILSTARAMLNSLRDEFNRFIYQNTLGSLFSEVFGTGGAGGGRRSGGAGGGGGLLGSVFSGTGFNPFGGVGGGGTFDFDPIGWLVSLFHTGRGPYESAQSTRQVSASSFTNAPRFHTGIGPGERAAVIEDSESVLTKAQMGALAPVSKMGGAAGDIKINLINQSGQQLDAKARRKDDGSVEVILRQVKDAVASDIANGEGSVFNAMQGRFGLRTAVA